MMSTVIAAIATKNARIRMFTRYVSSTSGARTTTPAVSKEATASAILADRPRASGTAVVSLSCCASGTRKSLRPDTEHDRREDRNRQPAEDRIDEGRYDHLTSAEHETGDRERKKRSAGHPHQHEGADHPRPTHVPADAPHRPSPPPAPPTHPPPTPPTP